MEGTNAIAEIATEGKFFAFSTANRPAVFFWFGLKLVALWAMATIMRVIDLAGSVEAFRLE